MATLSAIGGDWTMTSRVLPKVLAAGKASWMIETTLKNLRLLKTARERDGQTLPQLDQIVGYMQDRYQKLKGEEAEKAEG